MTEWKFQGPGGLKDFRDPEQWHKAMVEEAESIVSILVETALGKANPSEQEILEIAPTLAYVNPVTEAPPADAETIPIAPWGGFPSAVRRRVPWDLPQDPDDPDGTLRAAEHLGDEDHVAGVFVDKDGNKLDLPVRDRQDEYLEWALRRDSAGRITKAIFVAEGYDYFDRLFQHDEQRVLEIYKEFTELSTLTVDDLRAPKGIYRRSNDGRTRIVVEPGGFNPRNRHNITPGIVHLSHRANSLGAEVNLAGVSGIARKTTKGELLDGADAERLLCCSFGGNPNRNSDPLIGQQAYRQVLDGFRYTLADPVGLYITGVNTRRLLRPDNKTQVPREWWRTVRGTEADRRILRFELEVPASEKLTVSDLLVDGQPVKFGGQLADLLTVHLFVTRWKRPIVKGNKDVGPVVGCSATCCRQDGAENLVLSNGSCAPGYTLAFDDLITPGSSPVAVSFAANAGAAAQVRERVLTKGRRLP